MQRRYRSRGCEGEQNGQRGVDEMRSTGTGAAWGRGAYRRVGVCKCVGACRRALISHPLIRHAHQHHVEDDERCRKVGEQVGDRNRAEEVLDSVVTSPRGRRYRPVGEGLPFGKQSRLLAVEADFCRRGRPVGGGGRAAAGARRALRVAAPGPSAACRLGCLLVGLDLRLRVAKLEKDDGEEAEAG